MNKAKSICFVFLISALVMQSQATAELWEAMTQGVIYNVSFTPPSPPNGFHRTLLDPGDGIWIRSFEYEWKKGNDAYSCAPKSYLNQDKICQKDPRYWPDNGLSNYFCVPALDGNSCASQTYLGVTIQCCYDLQASDCDLKEQYCLTEYLDPEASS